jgi:hypothetical protein
MNNETINKNTMPEPNPAQAEFMYKTEDNS